MFIDDCKFYRFANITVLIIIITNIEKNVFMKYKLVLEYLDGCFLYRFK